MQIKIKVIVPFNQGKAFRYSHPSYLCIFVF